MGGYTLTTSLWLTVVVALGRLGILSCGWVTQVHVGFMPT